MAWRKVSDTHNDNEEGKHPSSNTSRKKSLPSFDKTGDMEEVENFAGAVGFFDSPETSEVPSKRRANSFDNGVMGFFECLDSEAEKTLGVSQSSFAFDGDLMRKTIGWEELASVLSHNPELLKVIIKNNELRSTDLQVLSGTLMKFHHLTVIDFSGNPLGIRGLSILLDCCRANMELLELHLSRIRLGEVQEQDYEVVCRTLDDFPSLHVLNLSHNNLPADLLRIFVSSVSEHKCISRLYLEYNNISAANASELLRFLPENRSLHTLYMSSRQSHSTSSMRKPLSLLKRRGVVQGKVAVVEALAHNLALRNVKIEGIPVHDQTKVAMILSQNESLWAHRESGRVGNASISGRGLNYIHPLLLSLVHLCELDLSHNSIESVPKEIVGLKALTWLSLEKNEISSASVPFHLQELKKLRYLNLSGNPMVSELPRDVAPDNCASIISWLARASQARDMVESQFAVAVVGQVPGEMAKIIAEVEKSSKKHRSVIIKATKGGIPTNFKSSLFGKVIPASTSQASLEGTPSSSNKGTVRKNRMSFRATGAETMRTLGNGFWMVLRECDSRLLSVFALFHRVMVLIVDMTDPEWEFTLRDQLGVLGTCSITPHVVVTLTNVGAQNATTEGRAALIRSVLQRFQFQKKKVQDVVIIAHELDYLLLYETLSSAILSLVDMQAAIARPLVSLVASLHHRFNLSAPYFSADVLSEDERKALKWAQNAGIFSAPLQGGFICSSLDWALNCFDILTELELSVFQREDLKLIFPADSFNEKSRESALNLLESAGSIVHTGWLKDQWIVQHQMLSGSSNSGKQLLAFSSMPAGSTLCTRVYRIVSPIVEVSVASVIRRVFLQTAGVLSDIAAISVNGFNGTLVLKDVVYAVQLAIERKGYLMIVVILQTDNRGQVLHMVTTAIERGLEEEEHKYERLFTVAASEREKSVDEQIEALVQAKNRFALTAVLTESIMDSVPDLKLFGSQRLFWDEFVIDKVIGKGSFGEVSLATRKRSQRKIAVKTIKKTTGSTEFRDILRELWVLSVLRHPNIVGPAGVCLEPLAVCMEYLELGDLHAFLDDHRSLPWRVRHSLLMDIASGMEYAHGRRPPLVHSDLKSPNILLCNQEGVLVAKIADLGLASFSSLNTVALVDNPLWSAPEMIQHEFCAPSVDVYSFAIISWEICSGCFPFQQDLKLLDGSLPKLREAIIAGRRPDLTRITATDIPGELLPLIRECWSAPQTRPSFREILGRLVEMVGYGDVVPEKTPRGNRTVLRNAHGLRKYVSSGMSSEPRTFCFVGGTCVVLCAEGMLWLFDCLTLKFGRMLRWKLAERVRAASSVTFQGSAYFAFGTEDVFVLNENLAARRIVGELTCCEMLCVVGDAVVVSGRNNAGVAFQIFREGRWEGKSWPMGDARSIVVALFAASDKEIGCVCSDKDGNSSVLIIALGSPKAARVSATFAGAKITAVSRVPWDADQLWLCCSSSLICVSRDTLKVMSKTENIHIKAPLCINSEGNSFVFGLLDGQPCLLGPDGEVEHKMFSHVVENEEHDVVVKLADSSLALQVPGNPHVIIGWSKFGLLSWRIDPYGSSPVEVLTPRRSLTSHYGSSSSSSSKAVALGKDRKSRNINLRTSALPSILSSRRSVTDTSSSSRNSIETQSLLKSSLHLSRKAMIRATVTCDNQGKIVSTNSGVEDIFGHEPSSLINASVRTLFFVPRTKDRSGSVLLYSRQPQQRFSSSDLWKSLMEDLLKVRLVNGQKKDGTLAPLLISSSELVIGGQQLYVLLFEQIQKKCALMVVDHSGMILSASDNLPSVIGWRADAVQGRGISTIVTHPDPQEYMMENRIDPDETFFAKAQSRNEQTVSVNMHVIEFVNKAYTLVLSLPGEQSVQVDLGEQLNHYKLGRVLGEGMCGSVLEGTHKLTGFKVAVKRIRKTDFDSAGVEYSGREVDLMRKLDHPNVVQLLDCVKLKNEMCLVMELVSGGELFSYCMDVGPLSEDEARGLFWDIVEAVDYIHEKGVVHRDLKLENCILENGRIKIIDFGLGNFFLDGPLKTSCGSPNYAAPELFLSRKYSGPPVDVWAIGVILYAMVTGSFPFDEIQATIDGDYEWYDELPTSHGLQDLIEGIFEVNADLRLTIAQMRTHSWLNQGTRPPSLTGGNEKLRPDIILRMETEYGMPVEIVVKSLKEDEVNHCTATYRMLKLGGSKFNGSKGTDYKVMDSVIKKMEFGDLDISLEDIKKRRQQGGGGGISKSNSGGLIGSTRSRSRSRSGFLGSPISPRSHSSGNPAVLGGGVAQAWRAAQPKRQHAKVPQAKDVLK
jgi:serine/threonine protein kinase/Leucine-rich repeat (LRR) protein